jgi:hypothetical protein
LPDGPIHESISIGRPSVIRYSTFDALSGLTEYFGMMDPLDLYVWEPCPSRSGSRAAPNRCTRAAIESMAVPSLAERLERSAAKRSRRGWSRSRARDAIVVWVPCCRRNCALGTIRFDPGFVVQPNVGARAAAEGRKSAERRKSRAAAESRSFRSPSGYLDQDRNRDRAILSARPLSRPLHACRGGCRFTHKRPA